MGKDILLLIHSYRQFFIKHTDIRIGTLYKKVSALILKRVVTFLKTLNVNFTQFF